jgi:uncharacterized Ntn-hydrolase superfamily protein
VGGVRRGAIATQSFAEPAYGPKGLALMRLGVDPATALAALTGADSDQRRRQVAFVDAGGRVAVHTGEQCIEAAGHVTADGRDRLMAALDAAEAVRSHTCQF